MAFIGANNPGKVTLSDVVINAAAPEPLVFDSGTQKTWSGYRNDSLVIPAGGYAVEVQNAELGEEIKVNGKFLKYGEKTSPVAFEDKVNNKQDFTTQITVDNPNGYNYWINVIYPSSNNINIAQVFG